MRYCVFAGSNRGAKIDYGLAAEELGESMAANEIGLVYGGAAVGLMGTIAGAVLKAGGEVIGVMPQALVDKEIAHKNPTDFRITSSMHERKALMISLSDGFIALPGGIGTLDEMFEAWTWAQLGFHKKPCGLLNSGGFYDRLLQFLDGTVTEGFLKPKHRAMLLQEKTPTPLLMAMEVYVSHSSEEKRGKQ